MLVVNPSMRFSVPECLAHPALAFDLNSIRFSPVSMKPSPVEMISPPRFSIPPNSFAPQFAIGSSLLTSQLPIILPQLAYLKVPPSPKNHPQMTISPQMKQYNKFYKQLRIPRHKKTCDKFHNRKQNRSSRKLKLGLTRYHRSYMNLVQYRYHSFKTMID